MSYINANRNPSLNSFTSQSSSAASQSTIGGTKGGTKVSQVSINEKIYTLSGRINQPQNIFVSLFNSLKQKGLYEVKITTDTGKVIVKANDLKQLLGINTKELQSLVKQNKVNNSLERLFEKTDDVAKDIIFKHRHQLSEKPLYVGDQKAIIYRKNDSFRVVRDSDIQLGKGAAKTVQLFESQNKDYAVGTILSPNEEDRKEYEMGKHLYDAFKKEFQGQAVPFVKHYTIVNLAYTQPLKQSKVDAAYARPSDTVQTVGILMERCSTDLDGALKKNNLRPEFKGEVALEVLKGVQFMHQHGIVHRDLKPANILLKDNHAKIADLGIAVEANDKEALTHHSGTPAYLPKEASVGTSNTIEEPKKIDSWSVGMIFSMMHFGTKPVKGQSISDFFEKHEPTSPENAGVTNVIRNLLIDNPKDRWSVQEALVALEKIKADNDGILLIGK